MHCVGIQTFDIAKNVRMLFVHDLASSFSVKNLKLLICMYVNTIVLSVDDDDDGVKPNHLVIIIIPVIKRLV